MKAGVLAHFRTAQGRDQLVTYATEAGALLGMLLTYRLAAYSSKTDLDLYVIARRTIAFIFPVVLMGAMVGLTRFTTMSATPEMARRYLRGALSWVLPLGLVIWLLCFLFARPLAWFIYGSEAGIPFIPPLGAMTLGIALHGVAYGYLRGRGAILIANALQLFVLAIAPCLAFVLFDDMVHVLWFTGISWVLSALFSISRSMLLPTGSYRREGAELLRYGLPRVPGDVALGALLTVPGYVALRTYGIDSSGEVGFGATLLNIAAAVFSPVALLLLPAAAAQLAGGDHAGLAHRIRGMERLILLASVGLMLSFEVLAVPVLDIYLGPSGREYVDMSRLIFIGALPFAYFNGMRSLLDAYFRTPRNGVNLMASFLILLVGSMIHLIVPTPWYTMAVVLDLALFYLGYATWRDVAFVRSELERLATRDEAHIGVVVVIPDKEEGETYTDSRDQAAYFKRYGAEVTLFHLPSRTSPMRLWRSRRELKKLLHVVRPDVVHVHYGSVAALFTVLTSSVPVMVTFMGDDLDRSRVNGVVRSRLGGFFSQIAAFFAAGIICTDERVRDLLWWRTSEAHIIGTGPQEVEAGIVLDHLRSVAFHKTGDV
ncbi:MAG: glycosyltransferase [Flavobacteriales bacterium]|nr:glycosyltransferase [Flavobacteriales bacterium]